MTGLIFATVREARPFLDQVGATQVEDDPSPVFRFAATAATAPGVVASAGRRRPLPRFA
jgi:hypothetical protein